jgi:rod shape-determining protein MreD
MVMRGRLLLFLIIFSVFGAVLQVTAVSQLSIGNVGLDILLPISIYFGLKVSRGWGFSMGVACGLFEDALSAGPLGLNIVRLSLCGWLSGFFRKRIYVDSIFMQMVINFSLGVFGYLAVYLVAIALFGQFRIYGFKFFKFVVLGSSLYAGLVAPIIFSILNKALPHPK